MELANKLVEVRERSLRSHLSIVWCLRLLVLEVFKDHGYVTFLLPPGKAEGTPLATRVTTTRALLLQFQGYDLDRLVAWVVGDLKS